MLINLHKIGLMCNRLMNFAHLIGFSLEHKVPIWNLAFEEYAPFFDGPSRDLLCRIPAGKTWIRGRRPRHLTWRLARRMSCRPEARTNSGSVESSIDHFSLEDPEFLDLCRKERVFLTTGWPVVDHDLVRKHQEIILDYLKPLARYYEVPTRVMTSLRRRAEVVVGVHARLGDYRVYQNGKYFYTLAQYGAMMRRISDLLDGRRAAFFLSSNEKVGDQISLQGPFDFASGSGHMIEDLVGLSLCDYIIGPPSTYSGWASYSGRVPLFHATDPEGMFELDDFLIKWSCREAE